MNKILCLLLTVVLCSGCIDSSTEPTNSTETLWLSSIPTDSLFISQTSIQTEIQFSLIEKIEADKRTVTLIFQTKKIYPSSGYIIVSNLIQNGYDIEVRLDSIKTPEGGLAVLAPATSYFELGELPNSLYYLNISVNGKTVPGLLFVTDTSYLVKIQPNNILIPNRTRLLRVPKNIIWGQAESYSPVEHNLFIDSLKIIGAKSEILTIGDYYYFKVVTRDSFVLPSTMGYRYGQKYLLKYDGDSVNLKNLVRRFARRYQDTLFIQLSGGRGEMYYSTVLRY